MTKVDYKVLKSYIVRSCRQSKPHTLRFNVDMERLEDLASNANLALIWSGSKSRKLITEMIPFIGEYYEKERLEWFSEEKEFTILTFVDKESLDERGWLLLEKIKAKQVDDPDNDKIHDIAVLLADYMCYNALVISYHYDTDKIPEYVPSYSIMCRANKVVLKNSDYQYNPQDFS